MSIGRICVRDVWTAEPGESIRDAARRMADQGVGTLVVLDEKRIPVGILTDRDVATRCVVEGLDPDRTTVSELMTTPVVMVREDAAIEDVLVQMASCRVRRMPVVNARSELEGIVAVDDIVDLLAEETSTLGRLLSRTR